MTQLVTHCIFLASLPTLLQICFGDENVKPIEAHDSTETTTRESYLTSHYDNIEINTTIPPISSTTAKFDDCPNLNSITSEVEDWRLDFKLKEEGYLETLNKQIARKDREVDEELRRIKQQKKPKCSNYVIGMQYILEKLEEEAGNIKRTLTLSNTTRMPNSFDYQPQRSPSDCLNIIEKSNKLTVRLHALDSELSTELLTDCTRPLREKLSIMVSNLEDILINEKERYKLSVVRNSVHGIEKGEFDKVKGDLEEIPWGDVNLNMDSLLEEIINKTLTKYPLNPKANFLNLLLFLKKFKDTVYFKSGMKVFINRMQDNKQLDTNQFLRLAYESKEAFDQELKSEFPQSFQELIWGETLCIINKRTFQYLMINRGNNETNGTSGNVGTSARGSTSKLPVQTARKAPTTDRRLILEYCGWDFYPIVDEDSINFVISHQINEKLDGNLNVDEHSKKAQVSPANVNPDFIWQLIPTDDGEYFSVYSLHPGLLSKATNGTYLDYALCSTDKREYVREVFVGPQTQDNLFCKWQLRKYI